MAIIYYSETSMTSIINPFKWGSSIYFPEIVSQISGLDNVHTIAFVYQSSM